MDLVEQLKQAIDRNDFAGVKALLTANPELHRAPLGYAQGGPLTWVAECRKPWEPPTVKRLAIAKWMVENGSNVHQGGDAPLMRAALNSDRIPMMELLVQLGADVNATWNGSFPIIFAPCETMDAASLQWLLAHGADPNCSLSGLSTTALDYVLGSYVREPEQLSECIRILLDAGGSTRYNHPAVLAVLRSQSDLLSEHLNADPALTDRRFPGLDIGVTGGRSLTLRGATLLHVAAEYGNLAAARLLIKRGSDVNVPAAIGEAQVGGQTPIFHAVTQPRDAGWKLTQFLIQQGADLSIRARLPGHYERPDEIVDCTPLGYARLFPGYPGATIKLLEESGAPEWLCGVGTFIR